MGQVIVVTGWSDKGYIEYGAKFAETFAQYWPENYKLFVYSETPVALPRGECRSLWSCPGVRDFINRYKNDPVACGLKSTDMWAPRFRGRKYNFRFDAVKFCRQIFIPLHAASEAQEDDIIVWLDGDVITFDKVPETYIEDTLGRADLCYLGRKKHYPEIGFWACKNNAAGFGFMKHMVRMYTSGRVFDLTEWHSAWVFNHCRKVCHDKGLRDVDLTPGGSGHVWFQSSLKAFSDHLKGDYRKKLGFSPEGRQGNRNGAVNLGGVR